MTMWKRERKHFRYYVTNERKQPHIYVEALGTPSASTEEQQKINKMLEEFTKAYKEASESFDFKEPVRFCRWCGAKLVKDKCPNGHPQ